MKSFSLVVLISLLFLLPPAVQAQEGNCKMNAQPSYYRVKVGDVDVAALADGTVVSDMNKLLLNGKPGEIARAFGSDFLTPQLTVSVNTYLVCLDGKRLLIDAGYGQFGGPTVGNLTNALAAVGVAAEDIDAILITHLHPDHVGGIVKDGQMIFPRATIYMSETDESYWLNNENKTTAADSTKAFFAIAQKSLRPYEKAGKVKRFTPGKPLFPGLTPIATVGHTPGHTSYMLESKGELMVFLGDIVHAAPVQFPDPDVAIVYDTDVHQAVKTRKSILNEAVRKEYWLAASHLSFPGIGHLRSDRQHGYRFVPVNYETFGGK